MKYDTIIIGGGLSGLIAGIRLVKTGQKVAIISSGQGALHFSTGSLGIYGTDPQGNDVESPIKAIAELPASHPYSKIGADRISFMADKVPGLFAMTGITVNGSIQKNHYRLTPTGVFKPTWLSSIDCAVTDRPNQPLWGKVAAIGIKGYLDFYPDFIAAGLGKVGLECRTATVGLPELEQLRLSAAEMRAPSIARVLKGDTLERYGRALEKAAGDAETIIIPSVVGLRDEEPVRQLRQITGRQVFCVPTQPMSVTGMRMVMSLRKNFESHGGVYLLGDNVTAGYMKNGRLEAVDTMNLGKASLYADNFILATGSYFSRGLVAEPDRICEPVFGLDVDAPADRSQWYVSDFFGHQPYMSYGVRTDERFRTYRDGKVVENLMAAGAILGGCNSLKENSGSGVAIITAMQVADIISGII